MTPESGRDIEIFTQAIQLPTEERVAFLDRACTGDEKLRRKIEALLRSNDRVGGVLDQPPMGSITEARPKASAGEKPGDRIDRYVLSQQVGEGGCGVVFLAEQKEPVLRQVALKIVKPGMDTKSVIARFEAERQALALMDHPGIAHIFDAGATESGRPYFVMEFVDGVRITDYCDRHSLSTSARLELFAQVCDAIQHAHQKGIIHRDIKPSNILVTTGPNGKPVLKVIDFGIAKATTDQQLTDKTLFTSLGMLIGTPAYMSPEQATLASAELDTRTDIYSLGVLLYELLTGTTPFDTRELLKAGLDEVRRVIREDEPARPSTRLSTMAGANLVDVSKHHGAHVPKRIREMRGELDWIVMKALEKDRARRYATANGLAMDVERYLSGEAILARPPSTSYKFQKLVARNKLIFSAVAVTFVLLLISLIATTRWLMVERGAREQLRQQMEIARMDEAGWELFYQAKYGEAEQLLIKSLTLRRQLPQAELTTPILHHIIVVQILVAQKKFDKVRPFLDEFVDPALLKRAGYKQSFESAVSKLIQRGLWADAAAIVERLHNAFPADYTVYHLQAPLLVAANDIEGYRRVCGQIVFRFGNATDPYIADKMAKDCLILPSAGVDLRVVAAMADVAVTRGSNAQAAPYFKFCKALAEYRLGNYEEAANWAYLASQGSFASPKAGAAAIIAMAQFKLNQLDQARTALTDCNKVIEEKAPKPEQEPGEEWRDWIIARALLSEAKQMIEGGSASTVPSADLPR